MNPIVDLNPILVGYYDMPPFGTIALNDVVLVAPNDLTNGAWTKLNTTILADATTDPFGGTLADRITDDATNGFHYAVQVPTGFVSGLPYTLSVYAKAGTGRWLFLGGDGIGTGTYVDLVAGVFGSITGTLTRRELINVGNGWFHIIIDFIATNANLWLAMASTDGVNSYAGTGTTLFLYGAQANQQKLSTWFDQSLTSTGTPNAHDLVQPAATAQPFLAANAWNGRPMARFDGADDYMQGLFTLNQPIWCAIAYRSLVIGANGVNDHVTDGNATDTVGLLSDSVPQLYAYAGAVGNLVSGRFADNVVEVVDFVINGASSDLRVRNVQRAAGNAGANNAGGFTIGASGNAIRQTNIDVGTILVCNAVPPSAIRDRVVRWLISRWHPRTYAAVA